MRFQPKYKPTYVFVKKGKTYHRVEKIVNRWNGQPPIEDEIKQSVKDRILSETSEEIKNKVRDYANNLIKKPTD